MNRLVDKMNTVSQLRWKSNMMGTKLISDDLFFRFNKIECIKIEAFSFPKMTDKTLMSLAKQQYLPTILSIKTLSSKFTAAAIAALIQVNYVFSLQINGFLAFGRKNLNVEKH